MTLFIESPKEVLLIALDNSLLQLFLCGADPLQPQLLTFGSAINVSSTLVATISIGFVEVSYPEEVLSSLIVNLS